MKKNIQYFIVFLLVLSAVLFSNEAEACAMCKETGNQAGGFSGRGLNTGILYLMAIPYVAAGILGYFWYKASKREKGQHQRIVEALKGKSQ